MLSENNKTKTKNSAEQRNKSKFSKNEREHQIMMEWFTKKSNQVEKSKVTYTNIRIIKQFAKKKQAQKIKINKAKQIVKVWMTCIKISTDKIKESE